MLCPEAMPRVEQKGQQSWEGSLADGTVGMHIYMNFRRGTYSLNMHEYHPGAY